MVKTHSMSATVSLEAEMIGIYGKGYPALSRARCLVVTLSQEQNLIVILLTRLNRRFGYGFESIFNPYTTKKQI